MIAVVCSNCGAETIEALTPGGNVVDLDPADVWVKADEPWPRVFTLGVAGGSSGPVVPCATPILGFVLDGEPPHGPFRKAHECLTS